jgi:hypothetical protein
MINFYYILTILGSCIDNEDNKKLEEKLNKEIAEYTFEVKTELGQTFYSKSKKDNMIAYHVNDGYLICDKKTKKVIYTTDIFASKKNDSYENVYWQIKGFNILYKECKIY